MAATYSQTTGNLIKTCMGVGILALPYTAILAGFVPSFLLIVIIALWVYYCMHLLIQTNEACTSVLIPTNEDPYKIGLGSFGVFLLNFSFIVTLIGVGAAYQITFNNMLANLPWIIWKFPLGKFTWFWTLIFGVLILPLVLLRSMGSISFASQAGNYILILVMIIVIVYGAIHNKPSFALRMLWPQDIMGIANMFGVICFSMGVAFVGLSSRSSMENPGRFKSALIVSLIVPSVIYIVFAFAGVIFYNEKGIRDIILANIPSDTLYYQISAIGLSLVCFLSYPIAVYPALIACEAWIKEGEY
ncbi:hypothetical protein JH06_3237 [Blastocystis sp. subtype 4]|uniref:hypothetical protein n=1 Tax=Blastocystis sp. subtype 4 TaxID=944170 RepID=UPI0007119A0A|nr:hypothetical protein JH06_3237 [Blastocystis sp. subtype 4]KNB43017.1 hypothetical protein JH06_3237 [Blastocystis sp. subtype 4]|eukprot:XP_014526460.1 hypothetical protein JH06_3237 [Blastocystis sp. subtype 4]